MRAGSLGALGLGMAQAFLEEVAINPPQNRQSLPSTGETGSGRAQTEPCATRTQEKGAGTPQETNPDLPVTVRESLAEVWVRGGLVQGWGALSVAVGVWGLLKEVNIIFITSTIVWFQVK